MNMRRKRKRLTHVQMEGHVLVTRSCQPLPLPRATQDVKTQMPRKQRQQLTEKQWLTGLVQGPVKGAGVVAEEAGAEAEVLLLGHLLQQAAHQHLFQGSHA